MMALEWKSGRRTTEVGQSIRLFSLKRLWIFTFSGRISSSVEWNHSPLMVLKLFWVDAEPGIGDFAQTGIRGKTGYRFNWWITKSINTRVIIATCVGGNGIQVAEGNLHIREQIFLCLQIVNFGMVDTYMDTCSKNSQLIRAIVASSTLATSTSISWLPGPLVSLLVSSCTKLTFHSTTEDFYLALAFQS